MKKKTISLVILLSIIFLLSSCDVTTLLDTFKGNVYEDVFDVDLVGDSAQEAADNVSQSLVPVLNDENEPVLPTQTDEEKEELKSTVAKAISSESSSDAFFDSLEEEASEEQGTAAKNTADDVNEKLDGLKDLDLDDNDLEAQIDELVDALMLDLPDNPTQADVLNVQLANNLVNSLSDALDLIDDEDASDDDIIDGFLDVISDAAFMLNVAKAQGSTSDLINSLDFSQLMDLFADDSGSSSDSDQTTSFNSEAVDTLNAFRSTVDLVLENILGIDPENVNEGMDSDILDAAIDNYKLQYSAFNSFLAVTKYNTTGIEYEITQDDLDEFAGIPGVISYTIATALVNVDTVFEELKPEDENYDTIKEIVDALIGANTSLVYPDEYTEDMEFFLPEDLVSIGQDFQGNSDDISDVLEDLGLEEKAKVFIDNAIYLVELTVSNPDDNLLLQALLEFHSSLTPEGEED